MKYKVGDEVLVKVRMVGDRSYGYALETYDDLLFTAKKDEVIPVPDMTAEEAWELAKKILLYPDHEIEEIFGRMEPLLELTPQEAKAKIGPGYGINRYKGLGEMNYDQLYATTMNKATRKLYQVKIDDPIVVEKRISVLMGNDASKRRAWIEENVVFNEEDRFIKEVKE